MSILPAIVTKTFLSIPTREERCLTYPEAELPPWRLLADCWQTAAYMIRQHSEGCPC